MLTKNKTKLLTVSITVTYTYKLHEQPRSNFNLPNLVQYRSDFSDFSLRSDLDLVYEYDYEVM